MGPFVLNVIPQGTVESMSIVTDMALAFIAFTIGCGFKISYFKRVGAAPIVIAICEAFGAVILVALMLILCGFDPSLAIVLGAIASATAPESTIMVIKQYGAKGPVTETLLSVVALDDAVALIAFGFAVAVAGMMNSVANVSFINSLLQPFIEVGISAGIGAVIGVLMAVPLRWWRKTSNRTIILVGGVLLAAALASMLGGSSILTCMVMGAMFTNVSKHADSMVQIADNVTPPIFLLFFVVAGAQLDITVIPTVGLIGAIYLVMRVVGKMGGASLGAKLSKAPKPVQRYLGPALIPQAGVAIGLAMVAQTVVPQYATVIQTVILCGTLIYEISGPMITKISLQKAGEISSDRSAKKKPEDPVMPNAT